METSPSAIPNGKLAEDVVNFAFRTYLGREPTKSDLPYQTAFLLDGGLSVQEFYEAIEGLSEAQDYRARLAAASPNEIFEIYECEFSIPGNSFLADCLRMPLGYEPWALPLFLDLCRPGSTVIDIGANWGVYSIPAAKRVGRTGRVFSFEPNPKNAKILINNSLRNKLENIDFLTVAISDRFGLAALHDALAQNSGVVFTDQADVVEQALHWDPVSTMPLDSMRDTLGRVDLIKMDIEGGEYKACMGAHNIIRNDLPIVFLEFTPILLRNVSKVEPAALLNIFLNLNYSINILRPEREPEQPAGNHNEIIEYVCNACNDIVTHIDLQLTPPSL